MGKGCVRFKSLEDLALDVVGRTVARASVEEHIANYRAARRTGKSAVKKARLRPVTSQACYADEASGVW